MKIAILSGKGGTGKTTITTNLALAIENCSVIDTDVEEPNSHLFFKPSITEIIPIYSKVPVVDLSICNLCGKCSSFCKFSAIFSTNKSIIIFDESCHDCGGCSLVCNLNAITYKKKEIGKIYSGNSNNINFKYGKLNIGQLSGVKIINQLKRLTEKEEILLIDCPPGTSCLTVSAVSDCDFAIIVVEPTPFGVSDMKMVVEMLQKMKIKFGFVINKAGLGDNEIYEYAKEKKVPILEEIPFDKKIATLYSEGEIFSNSLNSYVSIFENIFNKIKEEF